MGMKRWVCYSIYHLNEQVSVGLGYVFVVTLNVHEAGNLVRCRRSTVDDCRPHVLRRS